MPTIEETPAYRSLVRILNVGDVNDPVPSADEYAVQGATSLGYFELLCNGYTADRLPAIQNAFDKLQGYIGQITDPTIKDLLAKMMGILAPGGTSGSITANTIAAFNSAMTTTDKTQSPPLAILNWLVNTSTFSYEAASPDTLFDATMFMASLGVGDLSPLLVGQDLDGFMAKTAFGHPGAEWSSRFLNAYLYMHPEIPVSLIKEILPPDTAKAMPNYDNFVTLFDAGLPTPWPPVGDTAEEAVEGIMVYYEFLFNN